MTYNVSNAGREAEGDSFTVQPLLECDLTVSGWGRTKEQTKKNADDIPPLVICDKWLKIGIDSFKKQPKPLGKEVWHIYMCKKDVLLQNSCNEIIWITVFLNC